jgi:hypothetical protein
MRATVCLVLAACASFASADITLLEETRSFVLSAQGQSDLGSGGDSFSELGSSGNDDPFAPWNVSGSVFTNSAQSAIAAASGQFLMDINADGLSASGSLNTSASIFDETGYNAAAQASASLVVTFSLASESLWRLTVEGTGTMVLVLQDADGSFVFFHDNSGLDETHQLGPGQYTLNFTSTSTVNTFGVGAFEDASSLNASFVLVPGPGALAMGGLAAPLGLRRRR